MTNEEQQAYFAKQEQEMLDKCRIKSKEQFLDECKKAGIDEAEVLYVCGGIFRKPDGVSD